MHRRRNMPGSHWCMQQYFREGGHWSVSRSHHYLLLGPKTCMSIRGMGDGLSAYGTKHDANVAKIPGPRSRARVRRCAKIDTKGLSLGSTGSCLVLAARRGRTCSVLLWLASALVALLT